VHQTLGGPGLLESLYEEALCQELALRGISAQRQVHVPVTYKEQLLSNKLIVDLLVSELVIVEVKATEQHNRVYEAQLRTYLRLTDKRLGILINFGYPLLKDGIHRVVNNL